MRLGLLFFLFIAPLSQTFANTMVTAKVKAQDCVDTELVQVIMVKKDVAHQFMYQVGVPHLGNADFNLIPGQYRLEAISDKGCFGMHEFEVKENQSATKFDLELKK